MASTHPPRPTHNPEPAPVTQGLPGTPNMVYSEWTQEAIEPNWPSKLPEAIRPLFAEMSPMLTEPWSLEFYELVTPEKLKERNLP